jgi:hypothetical protein
MAHSTFGTGAVVVGIRHFAPQDILVLGCIRLACARTSRSVEVSFGHHARAFRQYIRESLCILG